MINAKSELLEELDSKYIRWAEIHYRSKDGIRKECYLKIEYTKDEYIEFLNVLDCEYDNGYGCQQLYGTVCFDDNTWLEREEYDGLEWWDLRAFPKIPEHLMLKNNGNK